VRECEVYFEGGRCQVCLSVLGLPRAWAISRPTSPRNTTATAANTLSRESACHTADRRVARKEAPPATSAPPLGSTTPPLVMVAVSEDGKRPSHHNQRQTGTDHWLITCSSHAQSTEGAAASPVQRIRSAFDCAKVWRFQTADDLDESSRSGAAKLNRPATPTRCGGAVMKPCDQCRMVLDEQHLQQLPPRPRPRPPERPRLVLAAW